MRTTVGDVTLIPGRPALAGQVREALLAAAQAGPYFQLHLLGAALAPGWLPVAQLGPAGLTTLTDDTARQLGTAEARVAASILHAGLAARLWSPVLACGLLDGVVPDLSSLMITTRPPVQLGVTSMTGWVAAAPEQLAELSAGVVGPQLAALEMALPVPLAAGLLRGNSASAMAGALGVLVSANPALAEPAAELARALLLTPALADAGALAATGLAFRRRSCCLYYRVPGGGLCGDCCFDSRPDTAS